MDKKSKILLVSIILAIFISVGMTFYETIVLHNFEVVNTNPEEE